MHFWNVLLEKETRDIRAIAISQETTTTLAFNWKWDRKRYIFSEESFQQKA